MSEASVLGCERLLAGLHEAVSLRDVDRVTARVKDHLEAVCRRSALRLPEGFRRPDGDRYARRLLHRDDDQGYTVVVMTWGPGQRTALHDHAGMWCVECIVEGALEVTQYDLLETDAVGRLFKFQEQETIRAGVGDAGRLIPPFEYHVLGNPSCDRPAISVHVYGGEMDHCNRYLPRSDGWWMRESTRLSYTSPV